MASKWIAPIVIFLVGLVYWPSWLGCQALQAAGGPIRIARGRRSSSSRVPSREGGKSKRRGGGGGSSSSSDRSFDASSNGGGRKATHKIKRSYSRGSMSVMARMRRKVGIVNMLPLMEHTTMGPSRKSQYLQSVCLGVKQDQSMQHSMPHPGSAI